MASLTIFRGGAHTGKSTALYNQIMDAAAGLRKLAE